VLPLPGRPPSWNALICSCLHACIVVWQVRWNALICSCASFDQLHPRRLHRLLASGVPFQHRMHVWEFCSRAACLRSLYSPSTYGLNADGNVLNGIDGNGLTDDGNERTHDGNGLKDTDGNGLSGTDGGGHRMAAAMALVDTAAPAILVDLLRTYPHHPFFCAAHAPLIAALHRLLLALAGHLPEMGYCQGLNFVAACLLLHGDEAGAFSLLATFCSRLLPNYHRPALDGLYRAQDALIRLLEQTVPAVHDRLQALGVPVREQTTAWLLCGTLDALPLEVRLCHEARRSSTYLSRLLY